MPLLTQHDADHPDALMRPMQSFGSKLKRGLWLLTWASLVPVHAESVSWMAVFCAAPLWGQTG